MNLSAAQRRTLSWLALALIALALLWLLAPVLTPFLIGAVMAYALHPTVERLVILLPDAWEERRDRGLAAAQLGAVKAAVADLSSYLENVPQAGDRFAINERLLELGHGDPSRLH